LGRRKINATYIVVKTETYHDGTIHTSPLTLENTFYPRETQATKHCRRYGVLYSPGDKGLGTSFKSRRAAQRAVERTLAYAQAHDLRAWPTADELKVIGVNLKENVLA
jgi:hypothetical protein